MTPDNKRPLHLETVRAVLTPALELIEKPACDDFYQKLDIDHDGFKGHTLISEHTFESAWGMWEMHPKGDELVYLVEGDITFVLRTGAGDQRVRLDTPGQYVIVPKGTWHTAETHEKTRALFITPGEGTQGGAEPPAR
ncbi:MAG: cupin domain-containing protein [Planctomycetes bacterium]|nr:cupin domain-containing protein [Planctomycetota bacterium]MCB9920484.1 cupin domain-containing protein [Planctomycetota bacterium]